MLALTIWQPWASLIAIGAKPYEFRRWAAPFHARQQHIGIHAGKRPVKVQEVEELLDKLDEPDAGGTALDPGLARILLQRCLETRDAVPLSVVVCTAFLGIPRKATALFRGDSDRIDHHVWAWPLSDVRPLYPPQPATGSQGFWRWGGPTL